MFPFLTIRHADSVLLVFVRYQLSGLLASSSAKLVSGSRFDRFWLSKEITATKVCLQTKLGKNSTLEPHFNAVLLFSKLHALLGLWGTSYLEMTKLQ